MPFDLGETLASLGRTPGVLDAWTRRLPDDVVRWRPDPDSWSVYDIVGHLIHGERTDWVPRIRIILEHGEGRVFESFDRTAMFDESQSHPLSVLLDRLASLREGNLATVRGQALTGVDLARKGRHPELGTVTLEQLLTTWKVHDLSHVAQIARVLSARDRDGVGPWRKYLPIVG